MTAKKYAIKSRKNKKSTNICSRISFIIKDKLHYILLLHIRYYIRFEMF